MGELLFFFGVVTALIWLLIGWRAMRAHEGLADQAKRYVDHVTSIERERQRRENDPRLKQQRQFKRFVDSNPEVQNLSPKAQHERFRESQNQGIEPKPEGE